MTYLLAQAASVAAAAGRVGPVGSVGLVGSAGPVGPADSAGAGGLTHVIGPYMPVFFAAFFVSFLVTPLMRMLARRNGVHDWPDRARKAHLQPTPYLGGVAIFVGWLAGVSLGYLAVINPNYFFGPALRSVGFPISIVLGAAAITLTGLFDDIYGISPRVKISGQLFAAAALASEDVGLRLVGNAFALLGVPLPSWLVYVLGTVVIAVFVIGGCNAMNLLDGLDGLASGVSAIAAFGFLVIAAIVAAGVLEQHSGHSVALLITDPKRLVMCLAIIGCVLGFLPYNFNPATIFMGDAGSLLLGYLCVTAILLFGDTTGTQPPLLLVTAALIVFAVPVTDTSLAIFRRKMAHQPLFSPDSRHIHHLLRRTGLSVRQAVFIIYGVALLFALLGIAMVAFSLRWRYILAVFVVIYGFITVTAYKYGQRLALAEKPPPSHNGSADVAASALKR